MLRPFEIHEPRTVEEASEMLARWGEAAAVYAGGTELLLLMKEGLAHFPHLVNLKTVPDLDELRLNGDGGALEIGALVTHRQLERSPLVRERAPLLAEVEGRVANARVRAVGTVGGNLCFAEPHSDPATLFLAWGATLELASARGVRRVALDDFLLGLLETDRRPDEVLTRIHLDLPPAGAGAAYERFGFHERPTATVAAVVRLVDGRVAEARLVVGSVGPRPVRIPEAERLMVGQFPEQDLFAEAGERAARAVEVVDDPYGSAAYKRHLVSTLAVRALAAAAAASREGTTP